MRNVLSIMTWGRALCACLLIALLSLTSAPQVQAYGVLAHEAVIDSVWDPAIKPLLLRRFPSATPDQLKEAHAYAYGGAILQDMGYYPFGSKLFSDLVHYVRSADFVRALIKDSSNLDEFAFALGAAAHYVADNDGHRLGVNRSVPILYPKLGAKYGDVVTYDEGPSQHLKTEFGFDVLQVAQKDYEPQSYHDYIGFEVAQPLLERAFRETYCLDLPSLFFDYNLAIGTFRRSVSSVIPQMTRVAWQIKKDEIHKQFPKATRKNFVYKLSRRSYEKQWHDNYEKPGLGARLLAFLITIIPKIGPFSTLSFRTPTPATEKLFLDSFTTTVNDYERLARNDENTGKLEIENDNMDTGTVTTPGQYPLADRTYAQLIDRLGKDHFAQVSPELRETLLSFYANPDAPNSMKRKEKEWQQIRDEVNELKATSAGN